MSLVPTGQTHPPVAQFTGPPAPQATELGRRRETIARGQGHLQLAPSAGSLMCPRAGHGFHSDWPPTPAHCLVSQERRLSGSSRKARCLWRVRL